MLPINRVLSQALLCALLSLGILLLSQPAALGQESAIVQERFENANEAYKNKDYARAYYWWNLLAEGGHARSQTNLGLLFLRGQGVDKNVSLAIRWMEKVAQQGVMTAQYNLGFLHATLKGKAS